jgi:hypothetical protein
MVLQYSTQTHKTGQDESLLPEESYSQEVTEAELRNGQDEFW